jgi:hypothetical protein
MLSARVRALARFRPLTIWHARTRDRISAHSFSPSNSRRLLCRRPLTTGPGSENAMVVNVDAVAPRTHMCGQVDTSVVGQRVYVIFCVTAYAYAPVCSRVSNNSCGVCIRVVSRSWYSVLCGWLQNSRPLGRELFQVLRDWSGFVQLQWDKDAASRQNQAEVFIKASSLHTESVVHIVGVVRARPADMVNSQMPNGAVEVEVERYSIFNAASLTPIPAPNIKSALAHLPVFLPAHPAAPGPTESSSNHSMPAASYFYQAQKHISSHTSSSSTSSSSGSSTTTNNTGPLAASSSGLASEELRLQYRYLDLRRAVLQKNLRLRAQVCDPSIGSSACGCHCRTRGSEGISHRQEKFVSPF